MKQAFTFTYKLTYEESYEAFLQVGMKWSKKVRKAIGVILTLIAIGLLGAYYLDSQKIHYFMMTILSILLLYYLIYVPELKAKRGAKAVAKQKGTYRVKLTEEGTAVLEKETIELAGDKDARAIETKDLYIIRPDRMHTLCIPKRVMKKEEVEEVRELLKQHMKYQVR